MMKHTITILLCIGIIQSSVFSQQDMLYYPVQMHHDLNKFRDALEYAHPGFYSHLSKEEFEIHFTTLISESSKPLRKIEFYKLVLKLVAHLHDGHTRTFALNHLRSYIGKQKLLPFHCYIKDERIFVSRYIGNGEVRDGAEIISINGHNTNYILSKLMEYYSGDGQSKGPIYYRFSSPFNSFYRIFPLIFGFNESYELVIKNHLSKGTKKFKVNSLEEGTFRENELKKYGDNLHPAGMAEILAIDAYNFHIDQENNYALMKIHRFFKDDFYEDENIYFNFYKEAFDKISKNKIQNLIIDIRGNGGGKGSNVGKLLQYFISTPLQPTWEISLNGDEHYFSNITQDQLDLNAYFGLKESTSGKMIVTRSDNITELQTFKPIAENSFNGEIYVLIDGGTLSAASMAAGLLREHTNAIFVGAETGGYSGMSNGIRQLSIRGDHTDVGINFPLLHSEFNVNPHLRDRGVTPDYTVDASIRDILEGKDVVLKFTLELIKQD
ncbi:S41 family peptidase [Poritiphilus flavus]|uniref:Tail specific protease domain-containing protein n=1 Tax=Poritiphilus flavus TaxID=2697053 RepID=A0A6L9EI05_9FLAO|nr:S41 family peptidase [Poritiphilus flavus]NAS13839.1 hypothetical protein [Poritiphilus flavus]